MIDAAATLLVAIASLVTAIGGVSWQAWKWHVQRRDRLAREERYRVKFADVDEQLDKCHASHAACEERERLSQAAAAERDRAMADRVARLEGFKDAHDRLVERIVSKL